MQASSAAAGEDAAPAMKVVNEEQQEEYQMIREINEEEDAAVPLAALRNVGDVLVNEPLNDTQPDDNAEEEKRDVVKMNTDDSVLSSNNAGVRG